MSKCCVIGLGYIGLPTASLLAKKGFNVLGVDINEDIVETINKGRIHIEEPELEDIVSSTVKEGFLKASLKPDLADYFIISVPTPIEEINSVIKPNLKFVYDALYSILPYIKKGNSIILESTCPVGTTKKILSIICKETLLKEDDIFIAYCPERVLPGNIISELQNNDRVIGGINKISSEKIKSLYERVCLGQIYCTNSDIAELVKIAENSYRDLNLAFANELSIICDKLGINSYELISLANYHPRVNILKPGCGVGGHCIAVDPWFLISQFPDETNIIKMSRDVNNLKAKWVINKIEEVVKNNFDNYQVITLGIFGLSFKANVGDTRESPAIDIFNSLKNKYKINVCEPNLKEYDELDLKSADKVIQNSDLLVFLVPHHQFTNLSLNGKIYLDFCGVFK